MATGHFEVDTDYLRKSNGELRQYLQTLIHAHDELCDQLLEVSGMWEGPAKDAFHLQFTNDCEEFSDLCRQLEEVFDSIENAATEYDMCDSRVRSVIDALKI